MVSPAVNLWQQVYNENWKHTEVYLGKVFIWELVGIITMLVKKNQLTRKINGLKCIWMSIFF